jgi:hypothetical protein
MIIQGSPDALSPVGLGGSTLGAAYVSDADIAAFVQQTLNDPTQTDAQKAYTIEVTAKAYAVSNADIAAATGYDLNTVNTYLSNAWQPPSFASVVAQDLAQNQTLPPPETPVTPAQTAPTSNQINDFVTQTLADPTTTDAQKATAIANAAIANNVTVDQIANATGYALSTVTSYLTQATIDPNINASNSVAYKSFIDATSAQVSSDHQTAVIDTFKTQQSATDIAHQLELQKQAAAKQAALDAANAAAAKAAAKTAADKAAADAAAKLAADQAAAAAVIAKQTAAQKAAIAAQQAALAAAAAKAKADADALASAKIKLSQDPNNATLINNVSTLTKKSSDSTQTLIDTQTKVATSVNTVANGQALPTTSTTGLLPILLAVASAYFLGQ